MIVFTIIENAGKSRISAFDPFLTTMITGDITLK